MGIVVKSEGDVPERGTFVRFKTGAESDWIIGMITVHEPICFIEGHDPYSSAAKKYRWDEVYEYQTARLGRGFSD